MKKMAGILGASLAGASLLAWVASSAAGASYSGPRHKRGGGRGGGSTFSVAEPASIALLGAGLIALGVFAKHKNGKNGKKS
jgi:hypothetical protein